MITASHNPADYNGIKICGPRAAGVSLASGLSRVRGSSPPRHLSTMAVPSPSTKGQRRPCAQQYVGAGCGH